MPDSTEELTGQILGSYRLVATLGRGGMGVVYKAYQAKLTRYVALKVLPRRYTDSPEFVARFWQEARAAARLQHPHIIPIFDYGEYEGYHYIAMPLVRDGSLAQLLDSQPLNLEQMAHIVLQVGSALDYAHSQDVVHRDVKPDNVLISRHSGCLLTDFGIAKLLETAGTVHLNPEGISFGTPAYMSPEQIRGDEDLDGRSDIYSLGVVMYQMATGRVPFQGTVDAIRDQHLFEPPPPPHTLNRALPRKVGEVITRALAKERAARYAAAADLSAALQAALPRGVVLGAALFRTDQDEGAAILGVGPGPAPLPAAPEGGSAAEESRPLEGDELMAVLRAASADVPPPQPPPGAPVVPWPPLPTLEDVRVVGAAAPEPSLSATHVDLAAPPSPPTPSPKLGRGGQRVRAIPIMAWAAGLVVVVVALALALLLSSGRGTRPPSPQAGAQPVVETPTQLAAAAITASPLPPSEVASTQRPATADQRPAVSSPTRQPTSPPPSATSTQQPATSTQPPPATNTPPPATNTPPPATSSQPLTAGSPTSQPSNLPTFQPSTPQPPDLSGLIAVPLMYGFEPKVYVATTGGELQTIVGAARQPDYSPDGARLIVNGDGGDWDKLRLLNALGGEPVEIGDPALPGHAYPSWSPDGSRVVYEDGALDSRGYRLYVRDLTASRPGAGPGTLLSAGVGRGEIFARHPLWAGGDRFIFHGCNTWQSGQESECGMWLMAGNGGAPRRLTPSPNHVPLDVRGETLLYSSAEKGNWSVYALDLASGASGSARQLTGDGANEGLAAFSPDGRSVAYLSDSGGRLAVWVVGLQGGEPLKLFDLPSEWGVLRPDGWGDEKLGWGTG